MEGKLTQGKPQKRSSIKNDEALTSKKSDEVSNEIVDEVDE